MSAVLRADRLRKVFRGGDDSILEILIDASMEVHRSEVVAIVGASGCGKSTLLHLLGALDVPSGGEIFLDGTPYSGLTSAERDVIRSQRIGFVFQFHHLLSDFSAIENVAMPLLIQGADRDFAHNRAEELLARVGLAGRMSHRPSQLSGGEQQRCAVARAAVTDPRVLLADEPSGNLDDLHSAELHDMLFELARDLETALVVVTHNRQLAQRADRTLRLTGGKMQSVDTIEALS
jgi:lipoprotein-releasing system ATP-binding protein